MQEFRVNTYQAQWQRNPDIARLADGGFVIVWDSFFSETAGSVYYIAAQRYDAAGNPVGSEQILSDVSLEARLPRVSALNDGGYAVSWEASPGSILAETDVYTASFDADGSPRGTPSRVNPAINEDVFAAETIATGQGYISLYSTEEPGGNQNGVWLRAYNADGTPAGSPVKVNATAPYDQMNARAELLSNGDVVVLFDSELSSAGGLGRDDLRARVFAPDGTPRGPEFVITTDNDGVNGGFDLTNTSMSVTGLMANRFVATWYDFEAINFSTSISALQGQIFYPDGTAEGPAFQITVDDGDEIRHSSVTALPDGGFVVAWDVYNREDSSLFLTDVYAQVFNEFGQAVGPEIVVAEARAGNQEWPSIVGLSGGRFVVTYQSEAIDSDNDGIAARIFDVPGGNLGGLTLTGTQGQDTLTGSFANDLISGLAGNDVLKGLGGTDNLSGGDGNDTLNGGDANDSLSGGKGNDTLKGNQGADTLSAGRGNDALFGGDGLDVLSGGKGNDTLAGGRGRDQLSGGDGRDSLAGGKGDDLLTGGKGDDSFIFTGGGGDDEITDFDTNADVIDLTAIAGIASFAELGTATTDTAQGALISLDATSSILLTGVTEAELSGANFLF